MHVRIVDLAGRIVRQLEGKSVDGEGRWSWDGHDERGMPLPGGIYHAVAETPRGRVVGRIVVLR